MAYRVFGTICFLFFSLSSLAQSTNYGQTLTQAALMIQGAISPACNTSSSCVQFVNEVIPRCQKLSGDAGCWCGNHDPLHFCAICMSNPTDNRTTADQTAAALEGHHDHHVACNAYQAALAASATASASSGGATSATSNSGGERAPIGAIVGGAIGGAIALSIAIAVLIIWLRQRENSRIGPSKMSLFSTPGVSTYARPYTTYEQPQPVSAHRTSQYGANSQYGGNSQYGANSQYGGYDSPSSPPGSQYGRANSPPSNQYGRANSPPGNQYGTHNDLSSPPGYTPSNVPYQPLGTYSPGPESSTPVPIRYKS